MGTCLPINSSTKSGGKTATVWCSLRQLTCCILLLASGSVMSNELPAPTSREIRAAHEFNSTRIISSRSADTSILRAAYTALLAGDYSRAKAGYQQLLQHAATQKQPRQQLAAWLGLAVIAQQHNALDEAQQYYRLALQQDAGNLTARLGMIALLTPSQPQIALTMARELVEQQPQSAAAHSTLAAALQHNQRPVDAQQAYDKASRMDPAHSVHAYNLAVALDRLHQPAQAATHYQRALQLHHIDQNLSDTTLNAAQQRLTQLHTLLSASAAEKPL